MTLIIAAAVGAFLNRWRGGGLVRLPGETLTNGRSQLRRLTALSVAGTGMWVLGFEWWQAVLACVAIFLSYMTGHGVPQGAAGGFNDAALVEWGPLDWICNRLAWNETSWGVIWLTLHGTLFGIFISLALFSFWPVILWACQGWIFYVIPRICLKLQEPATVRWPEYAMGVAYGLAVALAAG